MAVAKEPPRTGRNVQARPALSSLGRYLDQARRQCGMSLRALAAASGVPMSTVNRLLKGQVTKIRPSNLTALAEALELPAAEVFKHAGVVVADEHGCQADDLDILLRTRYRLDDEAIAAVRHAVDAATGATRTRRPAAEVHPRESE